MGLRSFNPARTRARLCVQLPQHLRQKVLHVAVDRHIRPLCRLGELSRIHIHLDLGGKPRKRGPVVARLANVQPRPQHQQHVRILHRKVSCALANRPWPPAEKLIVRRDQIVRPGRHHRNPQPADHCIELVERPSQSHPRPRKHHWPFRSLDPRQHIGHLFRDLRPVPYHRVFARVVVPHLRLINLDRLHVHRNVQPAWPRPPRLRQVPRPLQMIRNRLWLIHPHRILGNPLHHADDVDLLVAQLPQVGNAVRPHARLALRLPGENQHRDRVRPRAEDAVQRIDRPGPEVTFSSPGVLVIRA